MIAMSVTKMNVRKMITKCKIMRMSTQINECKKDDYIAYLVFFICDTIVVCDINLCL